jgi:predicted RNA-binding Zn-ribbon protein involved in translation (DUF1610 family)
MPSVSKKARPLPVWCPSCKRNLVRVEICKGVTFVCPICGATPKVDCNGKLVHFTVKCSDIEAASEIAP